MKRKTTFQLLAIFMLGIFGTPMLSAQVNADVEGTIRSTDNIPAMEWYDTGSGRVEGIADVFNDDLYLYATRGDLFLGATTAGGISTRVSVLGTNGFVGVGTTLPLDRLHINNGNIRLSSSSARNINFYNGTTLQSSISGIGTSLVYDAQGFSHTFRVGSGNRTGLQVIDFSAINSTQVNVPGQLRIGGNGDGSAWRVGISGDLIVRGYTSIRDSIAIRDGGILDIVQSNPGISNQQGIRWRSSPTSSQWRMMHTGSFLSFVLNNVRVAYVDTDGDYVVTSDRSLKQDIRPMSTTLSRLMMLTPSMYKYKWSTSDQASVGFIAQEVQEHFPETVSKGENGKLAIAYAHFGVYAVKAIQEQQSIIDAQHEEMQEMKDIIKQLEARLTALEQK